MVDPFLCSLLLICSFLWFSMPEEISTTVSCHLIISSGFRTELEAGKLQNSNEVKDHLVFHVQQKMVRIVMAVIHYQVCEMIENLAIQRFGQGGHGVL